MTTTVLRLELRRSRALLVGLTIVVLAYGAVISWFYPVIARNAELFEQYMSIFPKEFLAAFGMTGSLADPGNFFTTYLGSFLWPIVAAVAAIVVATRPAADAESGWIEVPLATAVPRRRYLLASVLVQALVVGILAIATVTGVVVGGAVVGAPFDTGRFLVAGLALYPFGCAIAAAAALLGATTLRRGLTAGIVAAGLIAMYLLNLVAEIQPDLTWLSGFSAFHYVAPSTMIDAGTLQTGDIAVLSAVAVGCWVGAIWVFGRRDLAV